MNASTYKIVENEVIQRSMKNIFHHYTVVSNVQYYCQQRNNIDVMQKAHPGFLLQFMSRSTINKLYRSKILAKHISFSLINCYV